MRIVRRLATVSTVVLILVGGARSAAATADVRPAGQMTWAVHVSLAPTWFDPAETSGTITSYMVLYALHDALVKPMPGNPAAPSLAESWSASSDGLVYEFALRRGARFHNGEPVTAEDVRFSFERYRGSAAKVIKDRVAAVEIPDPGRVRFRLNRQGYNQAELLGTAKITGSMIPSGFDFYWPPPPPAYDPTRAKALLAEAGYPNGFDAGEFFADLAFTGPEAVVNDLRGVGLGLKLRPLERAAFMKAFAEKKFKNLMYASSAVFGNAATRIESFVASGGMYVYGSYPDIDGLFRDQAGELDRKRREAALHRIQQLVHEKAMVAPLWEPSILSGFGPRVEDAGLGLIGGYPYSAPYEDIRLKGK
jgi:ABC-type transport system substrate-binding protein